MSSDPKTAPRERVAIVGAGYSGAMLAAQLAERGLASILIDPSPDFGLGVAYSTPFDGHLLNVRSGSMSAVADDPGHFVRWLARHHPAGADPDGFAPRRVFGRYVQQRLTAIEATHPGRIERVTGTATEILAQGVQLADGRTLAARAVVLATGNPAPGVARGESARIVADPWAEGALDRIGSADDILIIGTGLTMVDMLLVLEARGWRGRTRAMSRRGLMPRAHEPDPDTPAPLIPDLTSGRLSRRTQAARRVADRLGWRSLMEGLRPVTADLWRDADTETRSRIVRHLRPWWDVHRHRIAPEVAGVMYRLLSDQRLTLAAGRVRAVEADADTVTLRFVPRHARSEVGWTAAWLIDCSGPGHDPASHPLTGPLIASGRARLDPLRLGLDLDSKGRVLNADGHPDPRLFVLGPPARAAFWETIAVPDIRNHIEDIVAVLAQP